MHDGLIHALNKLENCNNCVLITLAYYPITHAAKIFQDHRLYQYQDDNTDLQIQALRHDISTATGRVFNAESLVTDPVNAVEFHDRAIKFLQHGDIEV